MGGAQLVTRSSLLAELEALGIGPGDAILLYADAQAIGHVVGGANVILAAILERITRDGTLAMHVGWDDAPTYGRYALPQLPWAWQQAYREEWPPFCAATSRADRDRGTLAEYLRTWPGAKRSVSPLASVAAVGAHAADLVSDHAVNYGYGERSPYAKLCAMDAKVLAIGVPLAQMTVLHHAEHLANVPLKRVAQYSVPVSRDGSRAWANVEEFDTSEGIVDWEGGDYFDAITHEARAAGMGGQGRAGGAVAHVFRVRPLVKFAIEWLERKL